MSQLPLTECLLCARSCVYVYTVGPLHTFPSSALTPAWEIQGPYDPISQMEDKSHRSPSDRAGPQPCICYL